MARGSFLSKRDAVHRVMVDTRGTDTKTYQQEDEHYRYL